LRGLAVVAIKGELGMSFDTHVEQLTQKHAALEATIHEETIRPNPDELRIAQLKKEKLKIKDEIVRLHTTTH
jgi:hypothetical protein